MADKQTDTAKESCADEILNTARDEKLDELEILRQSHEEIKKESGKYYDELLRLKAEFDNFRKRSEKEKQSFLDYGREKILSKQIMIYDVLEAALKSAQSTKNIDVLLEGLELISKEFIKMLEEEGVKEVQLKDNKFNPQFCEALDHEVCDAEEGTILNIYQKGYTLGGNLLRAAKVKVAKTASAPQDTKETN
ncbi:MAG: nucleotide exchange factor GrpE [Elusimicrobia bacterium]|nr:nucleotide exchange factor GrpE [Elusimicrobiota bacterium]